MTVPSLFKSQLRRPRFSIAEITEMVAVAAVAAVWPGSSFFCLFCVLVWLLCKVGLSVLLSTVLVAAILSVVLPTLMRPVAMHSISRR